LISFAFLRGTRSLAMSRRVSAAAALSIAFACAPSIAEAQSISTAPAAQSFSVGAMRVTVLHDGRLAIPNDGSVFGANASPAEVGELLSRAGQPTDKIYLDIDVLLVRSKGHIALIDAGYGPQGKSVLKDSLALAGASPSDVTDVFITHAHEDHVGGLVDASGKPAFPKAIIHISANEWRFMQDRPETRDVARAVRAQVRPFTPGAEVIPGIRSKAQYGHTPGHVKYELASGGDRLLDIGDTAHSSIVSLARPEWSIAWDSDKAMGAKRRADELEALAASHERMFAVHFPYPSVGYIARKGDGFVFVPNIPENRP
jgi:glyoxylase-like metal-dependent hydrolase (beta-lactamase superfamily II)